MSAHAHHLTGNNSSTAPLMSGLGRTRIHFKCTDSIQGLGCLLQVITCLRKFHHPAKRLQKRFSSIVARTPESWPVASSSSTNCLAIEGRSKHRSTVPAAIQFPPFEIANERRTASDGPSRTATLSPLGISMACRAATIFLAGVWGFQSARKPLTNDDVKGAGADQGPFLRRRGRDAPFAVHGHA